MASDIKKKSPVQAAQEAYEGEKRNAQEAWTRANDNADRATREAADAEIAAKAADVRAAKAIANMEAENSGKGTREDGSQRKPGKGKHWDAANAELAAAQKAKTEADAKKEVAVAARAAAQGQATELQKKVAEVSDGKVQEARAQEQKLANIELAKSIGLALAGGGLAHRAASAHGREIAKQTAELRKHLPNVSAKTAEGRKAMERVAGIMQGLKNSGSLDAMAKAKLLKFVAVGGVGIMAAGYAGSYYLRQNGNDTLADVLDAARVLEQGATAATAIHAVKANAAAKSGMSLVKAGESAVLAEAKAKLRSESRSVRTDAATKEAREKLKAAEAQAKAATQAANKATREAEKAKRKADKAAAQAQKQAEARAAQIIKDQKKADRKKAREAEKIAKGKAEAFDQGKAAGSKETKAKVREATGKKVAAQKVVAGKAESFKRGVTQGVKIGKAEAYREAGVATDKAAGRVRKGQALPTQAPTPPRATTKETLGLAKQAQARAATVGRMIAAAPTPTTTAANTVKTVAKTAPKPAGVKVGGQGKFAFAMTALALAATAVGAVTAGSGQAEAKESKRVGYVNRNGEAVQATPAMIAAWNRQKGGN